MRLLLIQGANTEALGFRQPEFYGTTSAAEIDDAVRAEAARLGVEITIAYTNSEGEAIDLIYSAHRDGVDGLLMNPGGFLYSGFALRDCLNSVPFPYVEIHLSNVHSRGMDPVQAPAAVGMVSGFGKNSYRLALNAMKDLLDVRAADGAS